MLKKIKHFILPTTLAFIYPFCSGAFVANAGDLQTFDFSVPEIKPSKILSDARSTNFDSISSVKRGSGKNVFLKVAPSVVKILTETGSGSGVIVSANDNGYIITNHHVIDGYESVGILFANDSAAEGVSVGQVIKFDEIKDLALVYLSQKRSDLVPINIAQNPISIGDDVHAIGHPVGEDWTYTRGYVSQIREDYSWQVGATGHHVADVIQTQTPINPGNSGGPLVNDSGELVGINTFGNTQYQGLNYSVANSSLYDFFEQKTNVSRNVIDEDGFGKLVNSIDENKNGNPDYYVFDRNLNEIGDLHAIDENEDLYAEFLSLDGNENDVFELTIFDFTTENGELWTVYVFDENEDGKADSRGIDFDRDGEIDKYLPAD